MAFGRESPPRILEADSSSFAFVGIRRTSMDDAAGVPTSAA